MISTRHNRSLFKYLIIGIGLLLFSAGYSIPAVEADQRLQYYEAINPDKNFQLTDQNGAPFELKDHQGKVILLFFGYLSCPDVCPVTLSKVSRVYQQLTESEREQVLTVFISVDTYRDTPDKIKEYLSYFGINAVGLTGEQMDIDFIVEDFDAWYQIVQSSSALGYLIDHTSYVYLLDREGNVRYLFRPEDDVKHMTNIIRKIYQAKSPAS
ncbi:MAG: SCO family protein [Candidatus Omnitrophica bacterium]|nr:SCO family protein [Candidatus Omnitrophota bacterium]